MKNSIAENRNRFARHSMPADLPASRLSLLLIGVLLPIVAWAQQPAEPVDINPIGGEKYYFIKQLSGLQMDLDNGSTTAGASVLIDNRSFTSLTQRWAMTRLSAGSWAISSLSNGLCLDSATS